MHEHKFPTAGTCTFAELRLRIIFYHQTNKTIHIWPSDCLVVLLMWTACGIGTHMWTPSSTSLPPHSLSSSPRRQAATTSDAWPQHEAGGPRLLCEARGRESPSVRWASCGHGAQQAHMPATTRKGAKRRARSPATTGGSSAWGSASGSGAIESMAAMRSSATAANPPRPSRLPLCISIRCPWVQIKHRGASIHLLLAHFVLHDAATSPILRLRKPHIRTQGKLVESHVGITVRACAKHSWCLTGLHVYQRRMCLSCRGVHFTAKVLEISSIEPSVYLCVVGSIQSSYKQNWKRHQELNMCTPGWIFFQCMHDPAPCIT